jgi:uncharacterized protein YjiK
VLSDKATTIDIPFPYDFSQLERYDLPAILNEVSGLTFDEEEGQLLAVEDERGVIYSLDKSNGSILSKNKFHKDGDYEGITMVGDYIFVLKSSGTIYKVKKGDYSADPEKIKGSLKKEFNLEGLTFDPYSNSLLVSCKEPTEMEGKNSRCLFSFDVNSKKMSKTPFLVIHREEILNHIRSHFSEEEAEEKFKKIINPDLDYLHLGPSGLAIHPITKDIFILSSKSKCLLVYDRDTKALVHLEKLDKRIFDQPEGISFDTSGNLYISSESKKKPAQLVVLAIQRSKIKS